MRNNVRLERLRTLRGEQVLQRAGRSQVGFFDFVSALLISQITVGLQRNKNTSRTERSFCRKEKKGDVDASQDASYSSRKVC